VNCDGAVFPSPLQVHFLGTRNVEATMESLVTERGHVEFEVRIARDGSVTMGPELCAPFLVSCLGWWRAAGASAAGQPHASAAAAVAVTAVPVTTTHVAATAVVSDISAPMDPRLFRALAQTGAFPTRRVGRRVLAVWGDVLAAVRGEMASAALPPRGTLDDLRLRLGLVPRGE
jgi:hypothetical protein